MRKCYEVDDDADNDRKKYGNDDDNAAAGSGYDGPIFDTITTPQSHQGLLKEDRSKTSTALRLWDRM